MRDKGVPFTYFTWFDLNSPRVVALFFWCICFTMVIKILDLQLSAMGSLFDLQYIVETKTVYPSTWFEIWGCYMQRRKTCLSNYQIPIYMLLLIQVLVNVAIDQLNHQGFWRGSPL
jgi:hypothetical protein